MFGYPEKRRRGANEHEKKSASHSIRIYETKRAQTARHTFLGEIGEERDRNEMSIGWNRQHIYVLPDSRTVPGRNHFEVVL